MALPTALSLHHADSTAELIFRMEFSAAIVVFSCALYFLVHQVLKHNHRLALDAEHRARHDWLTGLANRQYWLEVAAAIGPERASSAGPISLLYVDIDHFKQTNDRFGHAAGDRHLRRLARTLRAVMPARAIIGRFGGEEFVVLLPHTPLPEAVAVSERVNEALERDDAPETQMTASIGVATWMREESLDQFIARADRAMLEAKARGRRQTVVAGPAPSRLRSRETRPRAMATNAAWFPALEHADAGMSSD
jgi:diguanylate cyclase (GGDEF)-like protein